MSEALSLADVGKLILKARTNKGLTQDDIAKELGITRQTYATIEAGKAIGLNKRLVGLLSLISANTTPTNSVLVANTIRAVIEEHGVSYGEKTILYCSPDCIAKSVVMRLGSTQNNETNYQLQTEQEEKK